MRANKRTALLAGYGVLLALLGWCVAGVLRVQTELPEEHARIYRHYVENEDLLAHVRRNVTFAANHVRDFFLRPTEENAAVLKSQLETVSVQSSHAFARLKDLPGPGRQEKVAAELNDYWAMLAPLPDTMSVVDHEAQYAFLQREISPRRAALTDGLLELSHSARHEFERRGVELVEGRRQDERRLLLMLAATLLAALLLAGFTLHYAEALEQRSEDRYLETSEARRRFEQLSARLLEVEEEGRKLLSDELRNEIGRALAQLEVEIAGAHGREPTAELRERLVRARSLVERAMNSIRDVSLLLRPALLDDLGLAPALEYQLQEFMRRSGIDCEFSATAIPERLPETVKICVYRVVQEALHNCEKHAGASRVRLAVRQETDGLSVEIEDNGRGFEVGRKGPSRSTGLGIAGLRERAAMVGGALVLDSAPGRGTRISLSIPLACVAEAVA